MDVPEEANSMTENDDNNYSSTTATEQSLSDSNENSSLRRPRIPLDISSTSIKQEEPEADHDFLYDKVLNTPFKSSEYHATKAFKALNDLRKQKILCDVIIKAVPEVKLNSNSTNIETDSVEIYAHKVVLASVSPYFYAMFNSNMSESFSKHVVIKDICGLALETLIDFIYTCEIHINEENVQLLLPAANLLQLSDVKDACCEFLQYQLHPSNCLGIQQFADLHICKDLMQISKQFSENHFREIINHDEYLGLSVDKLESLVSSNSLSANEEEVFDAIKKWLDFNPQERHQYVHKLFCHIRFPLLSREFLIQLTKHDELIRNDQSCKDFLIDAMSYHLMSPDERINHRYSMMGITPRNPVAILRILMVIGGQAPKAIRTIEEYNFKQEKWTQNIELPSRRCRCGAVLEKGFIYVIGGFNGSLRLRTVDRYDWTNNKWEAVADMSAKRSTLGVAVLNGLIYAVGGFDGIHGLSSGEVYNPETDNWRSICPMSIRRSSIGVGVVNNLIYVVGGYDGLERECLSSVECYNPENDSWGLVGRMNCARSGPGVGVMDGLLYAVGGHDGPRVRRSVERYCPIKNVWTNIASMHLPRRNSGVVAYNGLLYVVGGDDGNSSLDSVEVYNPQKDSWSIMESGMIVGRSYSGVILVPSRTGHL